MAGDKKTSDKPGDLTIEEKEALQEELLRIGHMFSEHRNDPLMRSLAHLAIICAQERLIRE